MKFINKTMLSSQYNIILFSSTYFWKVFRKKTLIRHYIHYVTITTLNDFTSFYCALYVFLYNSTITSG